MAQRSRRTGTPASAAAAALLVTVLAAALGQPAAAARALMSGGLYGNASPNATASITATSCAPIFGYTAIPDADHAGDTLPSTPLSLADAAARCSQDLTCRGFNSARQLKAAVSPSQPQTGSCLYAKVVVVLGGSTASPWQLSSFPDASAHWLWTSPGAQTWAPQDVLSVFRTTFSLPNAAPSATLSMVGDDHCDAFLDDKYLGSVFYPHNGAKPDPVPSITLPSLPAGTHTLTLRCSNHAGDGSPAGVIASLRAADGATIAATNGLWEADTLDTLQVDAASITAMPYAFDLGRADMSPWHATPTYPDADAHWIWYTSDAASQARCDLLATFHTLFTYSRWDAKPATLHVAADDSVDIFLNGRFLGTFVGGWSDSSSGHHALPITLAAGENVLSMRVTEQYETKATAAGLLASVEVDGHYLLRTGGELWKAQYGNVYSN